ncbi:MAG TPA: hypothetical protein PK177_18985, partial [Burkholderiaceae bacterium]|nr:hypothetical protein [Burkholderiaceae bacterium]
MFSKHLAASPVLARQTVRAARIAGIAVLLGAALYATQAQAGRIVINNDEWTLSDTGYALAGGSNADTFVQNLLGFLGNGAAGHVLVYSNNFGLTESRFRASIDNAGYSVTVDTGISFDLPTLQGYDAIFLAGSGHAKNDAVLADYVNGGGGVYIAAGTGVGGAATEAAAWNGFLSGFGLGFGPSYNGVHDTLAPGSDHLLFSGVDQLYFWNGNSVLADASVAGASIRMSSTVGTGLIAVYDSGDASSGGGNPGDPPG